MLTVDTFPAFFIVDHFEACWRTGNVPHSEPSGPGFDPRSRQSGPGVLRYSKSGMLYVSSTRSQPRPAQPPTFRGWEMSTGNCYWEGTGEVVVNATAKMCIF
jgi:hypothetical protein